MKKTAILLGAALLAAPAAAKHHQSGHVMGKAHSMQCTAIPAGAPDALFNQFNAAFASKNPDTVTKLFTRDAVLLATVSHLHSSMMPISE